MAKFAEKNDGGIELHLSVEERVIITDALRVYSAYADLVGIKTSTILDRIAKICELMNVIDIEVEED